MTKKEEIKRMLPILKAFVDGKEIEMKTKEGSRWSKFNEDDFEYLNLTKCDFRIKPTPTYRPFANAEECWEEMKKHEPFGWMKSYNGDKYYLLDKIDNDMYFDSLVKGLIFADGQPFGKLTEEE